MRHIALRLHSLKGLIMKPGINIWSGAEGLGGALTNMSELAKKKGKIKHSYFVKVDGVVYHDSEAAYQRLKRPGQDVFNDNLMIHIIGHKLQQNAKLLSLVIENGGKAWLETCSHQTGAKSPSFQSWEGIGRRSRFIRNLIAGFEMALHSDIPETLPGAQLALLD